MKYKILALCALSFSTPSLYSITTTNKIDIANATKTGPAGIPAMCDNLRSSGVLDNPVEINSSSAGQRFQKADWNVDRLTVTDACARGVARGVARRGAPAAAAPPPAAPTDYEEMSRFLKFNTVNNPSLDLKELVATQGKSSVDYTHQEWINLGLFYDLLRTTAGLPKQPLRRKPARGKPAPGGGHPKPAAVNMAALTEELTGAFLADPEVTDVTIRTTILVGKALSRAQRKEIEQHIDYLRAMGNWRKYITDELKTNRRLTASQILDGHGIAEDDYKVLQRFVEEEQKRLNTPPVGRPPVLGHGGAGALPPRGLPPVTPTILRELEDKVISGVATNPSITLDEILRINDLSKDTLATKDYNRLKEAFADAKGSAGDGPGGVMVDPAPVGGGGDFRPPNPPPLPDFEPGGDPAPVGGGGGYGGMVRPTPVANQNPGGRPEMPGGLLGQIQGYGGRGSLRKTNPDGGGGAPAAGGGDGAAAAGPVPFNPANPMFGQPLTGHQKQNLIAEVERIYQTLPQGTPEEEAERIIEQKIRANNKWLTEANIRQLRSIVQEMVVSDDWG